jgi:sugar transferase (PEP-CTERM system associated)
VLRVFRHYLSGSALCLFACEATAIFLTLVAAVTLFQVTDLTDGRATGRMLAAILILSVLNAIAMYSIGLYDRALINHFNQALPRLIAVCTIFTVVAALAIASLLVPDRGPQGGLFLYGSVAGIAFAGVLVARVSFAAVTRIAVRPRRVLVVGVGNLAAEIEYMMSRQPPSTSEVVGYVALIDEKPEIPQSRITRIKKSLVALAHQHDVKEIVVALSDRRGTSLQPLLEARMEGITITSYLSFWERETRRVNLQALDPSWLIYSDGFRMGTLTNTFLKRALDLSMSGVLLLFTLPTLILATIAIRLDSPGPILYRQERVGKNGKLFTIYKFRTMRVDAESNGIPQWAAPRDPRITRVGRLLRVTRIDELPQIVNVLRGDMSFVGPRPERPFFVDSLSASMPYYSERHRVRPGITGWAQINYVYGASIDDAKVKLSYDLYYIKNYSLLFDFLIILSTAEAVFFGKGAR